MLPSNESVGEFLTGLGTDEPQVVASLELLGARDDPDIYIGWETARAAIEGRFPGDHYVANTNVPITHHCVMAVALRIKFPELSNYPNDSWAVGAMAVRLHPEPGEGGLSRWVNLPTPVRRVMVVMDGERRRLANGEAFTPTYPKLMAPRKVPS